MATVVFDLDGTLADTSGDLIAAANTVFRAGGHGDVLDPVGDALTAFHGARAMLRLGYERLGIGSGQGIEALVMAGYDPLLDAYGAAIDTHTRLYPGAMAAVEALSEAGYRVAICTNKTEALAETLLTRLGIRAAFAGLIGADTLPVRKPDPAPLHAAVARAGGTRGRAVLIGDTVTDRDTARAAGVPCVLVGFGPSGPAITALDPDAVLDHYDDLPDLIARLLPQEDRGAG
ncbi:MAG: HAD-IA family hydrolase [Qingshengfaniella sp.]